MTDSLVSVVMPVYNGERFVAAAVESVLAQSYRSLELLIVNDGSTDGSYLALEPFLHDSRVRYFEQQNAGVAAARNLALRHARGEAVAFIDQDDLWLPTKIEVQVAELSRNPTIGLVHSAYERIDAEGIRIAPPRFGRWEPSVKGRCFRELFTRNRIGLLTAIVRRTCLDSVGGFDERIAGADDYELWLRVSQRYEIGYVPTVLALYRVHQHNASHDRLKMELAELGAIDVFVARSPELRRELGIRLVNDRLHELCFDVARYQAWLGGDQAAARHYFSRALRYRPLSAPALAGLLGAIIPRRWVGMARWYVHRLRQIAGNARDRTSR